MLGRTCHLTSTYLIIENLTPKRTRFKMIFHVKGKCKYVWNTWF